MNTVDGVGLTPNLHRSLTGPPGNAGEDLGRNWHPLSKSLVDLGSQRLALVFTNWGEWRVYHIRRSLFDLSCQHSSLMGDMGHLAG